MAHTLSLVFPGWFLAITILIAGTCAVHRTALSTSGGNKHIRTAGVGLIYLSLALITSCWGMLLFLPAQAGPGLF